MADDNVVWRIFYDNGETYSNQDGSLKDAPAFGVLAVVCEPDIWRCGDFVGLIEYLQRIGLVKFGKLTDNETYASVLHGARNDTSFNNDRYVLERSDYYWYEGER